jgi:hypothetical protein
MGFAKNSCVPPWLRCEIYKDEPGKTAVRYFQTCRTTGSTLQTSRRQWSPTWLSDNFTRFEEPLLPPTSHWTFSVSCFLKEKSLEMWRAVECELFQLIGVSIPIISLDVPGPSLAHRKKNASLKRLSEGMFRSRTTAICCVRTRICNALQIKRKSKGFKEYR